MFNTPRARFAPALVMLAMGSGALAQQKQCSDGIIKLPLNFNGTLTICPALAEQAPALSRQLAETSRSLNTQQEQLNRLIKGVNTVGQNLGPGARQS